MTELEKSSRASTDVEAQETLAVKEAPVATPGQQPAEPTTAQSAAHVFPEGGRDAWLALLGAWAVMFITFGYMNAFGYVDRFRQMRCNGSRLYNLTKDEIVYTRTITARTCYEMNLLQTLHG
jgi:hypothetical protein